jgi:hypothetical protein
VRENDEPKEISSFAWVTDQPVSLTVILDTSARLCRDPVRRRDSLKLSTVDSGR